MSAKENRSRTHIENVESIKKLWVNAAGFMESESKVELRAKQIVHT